MSTLAISTLFLLIPLYIFMTNTDKNMYEVILVLFLTINVIVSFIFWMNPVQHSRIHYYDGIFGKITFVMVTIYVLFIKRINDTARTIFHLILTASLILFYISDTCSTKEWCCREHIVCHFIFHFFISIGCIFAFI